MIKLSTKFKPANSYTSDFIKEQIIPKLDNRLSVVENATQEDLIIAVSSFFAHGMNSYVVDCSGNHLLEEILKKLVGYGWLRPDDTVKDVFRVDLPNSRLEFVTVKYDINALKVETSYNTKYLDGSHEEVNKADIRYVDGYPVEYWNSLQSA
ncbi:hypothetical protein E4191_00720 [Paracoccus liaowanqingii]|uniref:Uncharacterized protein n=1 Tax=Paracoccus liaowanqingii TaxID=2560053 RepID=A0A4V1BIJ1_9RHOB|nr:hypothetical protein [Paracoccus liaowanqingii]QBX33402.1 hypothetical protein E4191_00720 [Paracoccus liaowanqingii]